MTEPEPPMPTAAESKRASRKTWQPALALALSATALVLSIFAPLPSFAAASSSQAPAPPSTYRLPKSFKGNLPISQLTEDQAILLALNRLAYGPTPGEVDRIKQMGLAKWIDRQLNPSSMDDSALQSRLSSYAVLRMSTRQLLARFVPLQQQAKREGIPLSQLEQQRRQEIQQQIAALRQSGDFTPAAAQQIRIGGTPQEILAQLSAAKLLRAVYDPRQLYERLANFWFNHFNVYARKGPDLWYLAAYERETIRPHAMGYFETLLQATAKSPAMLFYLDNWLSVDPTLYARMRQRILQRREQMALLRSCGIYLPLATPAQILRCQARAERHPRRLAAQDAAIARKIPDRGLNENYGRELIELHLLGVHYTQSDVIQMSNIFTGWTIRQPRLDPEFFFNARLHTPGPKTVLGYRIDAGGIRDGEQILHDLAGDPRTAHFLCRELARHFVMDHPPASLVRRMESVYLKSHGDIRQVVRAMIDSPEFWSRAAFDARVKTPFDLVASALRATGADVQNALPLLGWIGRMGEPLYLCVQPNGYSETASTWVSTGNLLDRMNFAIALATNHVSGTQVDLSALLPPDAARNPEEILHAAFADILANQVSSGTRATLERRVAAPQTLNPNLNPRAPRPGPGLIFGLVLGSPDFQRQ